MTIDQLSKSLFAHFLFREPVEDNMATGSYKRDKEIANIVALMNMLYDLALHDWKSEAGSDDGNQRRLNRLFGSKSMMAWSELLSGAVCGTLHLHDKDDQLRPFYRELSPKDLEHVKHVIERLVNWNMWSAPPNHAFDQILADSKSRVKDWFRSKGLTAGYLMGAPE